MTITPIAHIHSDYKSKFGIPRQSGLAPDSIGVIEFEPKFRTADALRGLDMPAEQARSFSHIWLIWGFSENRDTEWSPTVRPPRLGGNERVGVFATRSPFRPNGLGLSAVRIIKIELDNPANPLIYVAGADLMDGSPIYDIKPYVPYSDIISDAKSGFAASSDRAKLSVEIPKEMVEKIPAGKQTALIQSLSLDPRPAYQNDPERVYGMDFANLNVRFTVTENVLTVVELTENMLLEQQNGPPFN